MLTYFTLITVSDRLYRTVFLSFCFGYFVFLLSFHCVIVMLNAAT